MRVYFLLISGAQIVATLLWCAQLNAAPAKTVDGYRGIWYMNQPTGDEYRYKYSGSLATYPQQHEPIAIYSSQANKTFFCYGGTTGKPHELACMVSYFDHATGKVPRPRIVLIKHTGDAHENPTLQIDDAGHLWVFCNTHGPANNSYIFRSVAPYSIDEFEQVARTNFSYSQPWYVPGKGFFFLHTRYKIGRRLLHWMTSTDGREWSKPTLLAAVENGHYQISSRLGERMATAFNFHPKRGGLNARTNLYYIETTDMGKTWCTAAGKMIVTPITGKRNDALVFNYEAERRLVYLKDLNFDRDGRPIILYLTSAGYEPGPVSGPRNGSRPIGPATPGSGGPLRHPTTTTTSARCTSKATSGGSLLRPNRVRNLFARAAKWSYGPAATKAAPGQNSNNSLATANSTTRMLVVQLVRIRSSTLCGPMAIHSRPPIHICISRTAMAATCGVCRRRWRASVRSQTSRGRQAANFWTVVANCYTAGIMTCATRFRASLTCVIPGTHRDIKSTINRIEYRLPCAVRGAVRGDGNCRSIFGFGCNQTTYGDAVVGRGAGSHQTG